MPRRAGCGCGHEHRGPRGDAGRCSRDRPGPHRRLAGRLSRARLRRRPRGARRGRRHREVRRPDRDRAGRTPARRRPGCERRGLLHLRRGSRRRRRPDSRRSTPSTSRPSAWDGAGRDRPADRRAGRSGRPREPRGAGLDPARQLPTPATSTCGAASGVPTADVRVGRTPRRRTAATCPRCASSDASTRTECPRATRSGWPGSTCTRRWPDGRSLRTDFRVPPWRPPTWPVVRSWRWCPGASTCSPGSPATCRSPCTRTSGWTAPGTSIDRAPRGRGGPAWQVRVVLEVEDRVAVGFRLPVVELVPTAAEDTVVGHLGPDLLGADWDAQAAEEAVRRLRSDPEREIGLALLDQRLVAGLGNLYRCELLFLRGIAPWTRVRRRRRQPRRRRGPGAPAAVREPR